MNKRIFAVLLFVFVVFCSCSSKKESAVVRHGDISMQDNSNKNRDEDVTYEDLKKRHYDMQQESTKKMMKENEKRSKDVRYKRKKGFSLFGRGKGGSCTENINDEVVKDGVKDSRY